MDDSAERMGSVFAGRYTLERELGAGGMATVYLTTDHKHNRKVAVKVLRPEFAAAVGRDRFLREIATVGHLSHPHILPLYDSGVVGDLCYFVMPYVDEGTSLRTRLDREGQLPIEEAIQIAREIADGLGCAHAQHVVHRDIKPQNVMLEAGHAVIADFGIALALDGEPAERLTNTGFTLGTPHYMSPEQASAARRIDGRSDIYSLGCVLYEMLAGHPPFTGPTLHAIVARHMAEPPASLRIMRETVSESLERVCFRMLAKSPADRYRTAEEVIVALTEVSHERVRETAPARTTGGTPVTIPAGPQLGIGGPPVPPSNAVGARTSERRAYLAVGGAGVLLITAIGFLNTIIYDLRLNVPAIYTPTRIDYPIIGIRALIPGLYVGFLSLVVYVLLKHTLVPAIKWLAHRSSSARESLERLRTTTDPFKEAVRRKPAAAIAEIWFLAAIAASVAVLVPFTPLLAAITDQMPQQESAAILSCASRTLHKNFTTAAALLIIGVAISWNIVFRRTEGVNSGVHVQLMRWGGIAWMVILVLTLTAPWRLLWGENPRALLDGERVYIIRESEAGLLLFHPLTGTTGLLTSTELRRLQDIGSPGYIFEGNTMFDTRDSRC